MTSIVYPTLTFGADLAQSGRGSKSNVTSLADVAERAKREPDLMPANDSQDREPPEPVIEGKWAAWKVTTLVILFSLAAWTALILGGKAIFSMLFH